MTPLEWEIRLHNEVSAAAKEAAMDLRTFAATVKQVESMMKDLTKAEVDEGKEASKSKEEHEGFFGEMLKAEVVAEGIEHVAEVVADLAKEFAETAVEATDFDYKTKVALTHMTGSAEEAEEIMTQARAAANGLGEDVDKVTGIMQRFADAGLRGEQLTAVVDAAKDLGEVSHRGFEQTAEIFEYVASDAGLSGRMVRQLRQYPSLLKELEEHFHIAGAGGTKAMEQLTKALDEVPIKGAEGLALLQNMILKVAHEKELGTVGVEMAESFQGSFTRIGNDWKEILGDMAESPLFADLRRELAMVADYFDPIKGHGKEVEKALNDVLLPVAKIVEELAEHPDIITKFLGDSVTTAKELAQAVGVVAGFIEKIASWTHVGPKDEKEAAEFELDEQVKARRLAGWFGMPEPKDEIANLHPNQLPPLAPVPALAGGGHVDEEGFAYLHPEEEVVPAKVTRGGDVSTNSSTMGNVTFQFNITLAPGSVKEQMDEQTLAAKMKEVALGELMSAIETLAQMKGGK